VCKEISEQLGAFLGHYATGDFRFWMHGTAMLLIASFTIACPEHYVTHL
jgi:hypothetical protein